MTTVITHARLFDCISDEPQENYTLVIEDGAIKDIYSGEKKGLVDAQTIDAGNKTVMPGLIDAHVHVAFTEKPGTIRRGDSPPFYAAMCMARYLKGAIMGGFTTFRNVGWTHWSVRQAVEDGMVKGPRLQIASAPLTVIGGHFDRSEYGETLFQKDRDRLYKFPRICGGVDDCRNAVREQIRSGADLIKISSTGGLTDPSGEFWHLQFCEDEIKAIVEEAGFAGLYVADHCEHYVAMKRSVACGVRSIEHGLLLDEEAAELMKEKGAFHVPTILVFSRFDKRSKQKGAPPAFVKKIQEPLGPEYGSILDMQMRSVEISHRVGVQMGSGTDLSAWGWAAGHRNGMELKLKTECGLTPVEAINSATVVNSKILRLEDKIGTLETGKLADIIIVDGHPDEDIELLANPDKIVYVMKEGKEFKNTL